MNSPSNNRQRTARKARRGLSRSFFFLVIPVVLWASGSNGLFSVVPAQDKTYVQLEQLVEAGLLNAGDVAYPLSRYDVAKRILAAQDQYDQRVMAQAGGEIPPPPDALVTSTADSAVPPPSAERPGLAATTGLAGTPVPVLTSIPDGTPVPFGTPVPPHGIQKALKPLTSLKEAYQYELKEVVKAKLLKVQKEADELDSKQYDLRKKIVGVGEYPTLAIHGLGRAFGLSQLYTGAMPGYVTQPGTQTFSGYLDLNPEGVVSKEVGWNTILRLETPMQPNADSVITFRSAAIHFDPSWMSATLGDFEESYTPLVMWNRNTLDLRYVPEMMARQDDTAKYESFLNHEPDWPLRGVKIGTELMWPDSPIVERFQVSAFADMVHDSLNDYGGFIGPGQYTDWIFGGKAYLQSPKQYWEDGSWQWDLSACGLVMDEPLDSNPGLAYDPYNASTWAHQYLIGSVQPGLKVTLGGNSPWGPPRNSLFPATRTTSSTPTGSSTTTPFWAAPISESAIPGSPSTTFTWTPISIRRWPKPGRTRSRTCRDLARWPVQDFSRPRSGDNFSFLPSLGPGGSLATMTGPRTIPSPTGWRPPTGWAWEWKWISGPWNNAPCGSWGRLTSCRKWRTIWSPTRPTRLWSPWTRPWGPVRSPHGNSPISMPDPPSTWGR